MRLGSFQLPNGASLSYAEYGTSTGNPVLLFHGLVGSICSEGMEESLCGLPVRVIALARPGYGASDYFDMDCVADWGRLLAEFWDHLELWSFDIVGISAGAPYAYSLAALYPDRIGTLYINSGIPAVCFPNVLAQYPAQDAALYRAFRGMSRQEAGQALYDSYLPLFPEAALQSRDFRDSMGSDLRNIGQEAKLQEAPWGFKLSEVRCPVVLLHGTADSEVPYSAMEETAKELPHARIIKLEGEARIPRNHGQTDGGITPARQGMSRLFRRDSSGRIFYQHPKAGGLGWEADGRHDELGTRSSGPLGAELPETESRSHHTGPWLRRWSQSGRPAEAVSRRHSRGSGLLLRQREKSERCKLPSHRRGTVPGNPGGCAGTAFCR